MKQDRTVCILLALMTLLCGSVNAQLFDESYKINYDTSYIKVYKDELTTRIYLARKQSGFTLGDKLLSPDLQYKTNDNLLLGLGYTYSFLTINLAVKMPFINTDDDIYGESKYLDLSFQTMFRSFIADFYFQWNRGYYISNPEDYMARVTGNSYPIRGDLRTNLVGFSVSYLFNSERFSYKASFQQNEFQKRSAGSPIAGVEGYWMLSMADSSFTSGLVPELLADDESSFNQADIYNFGLNGGYAYTFVWKERFYLSIATTFGLSGGFHNVHNTAESYTCCQGASAGLTNNTKIAVGYNNNDYYVGVSFVRFSLHQLVPPLNEWITYNSGHIRVSLVKRFRLKRTIKILRPDLWIF
jgi:hypothetical protein